MAVLKLKCFSMLTVIFLLKLADPAQSENASSFDKYCESINTNTGIKCMFYTPYNNADQPMAFKCDGFD